MTWFPEIPIWFEKGFGKIVFGRRRFSGKYFLKRLSFNILFTFWTEKEFGSYKTFWEKESLHGLVYLRFCVCRVKEFRTYFTLVSFFYLNLIYQILFKKKKSVAWFIRFLCAKLVSFLWEKTKFLWVWLFKVLAKSLRANIVLTICFC